MNTTIIKDPLFCTFLTADLLYIQSHINNIKDAPTHHQLSKMQIQCDLSVQGGPTVFYNGNGSNKYAVLEMSSLKYKELY